MPLKFIPIEINGIKYFGDNSGLIYEKTTEGIPGKLLGRTSFLDGKSIVTLEKYENMRQQYLHNKQKEYEESIESNIHYKKELNDKYSELNKKMRYSLPHLNPEFKMPSNPDNIFRTANGSFYKKNGETFTILESYNRRRRKPIDLEKMYNRKQIEKPLWEKLHKDYQEIQSQYEQMLKNVNEKAIREEIERKQQEYEKTDPGVLEEIERRYNGIFEGLKEKEVQINRGKRVSLEPGEFSGSLHMEPGTRSNIFIERYKLLSKPYHDRFMEEIERLRKKQNIQQGGKGKTRKGRKASKKSRKIKRA